MFVRMWMKTYMVKKPATTKDPKMEDPQIFRFLRTRKWSVARSPLRYKTKTNTDNKTIYVHCARSTWFYPTGKQEAGR